MAWVNGATGRSTAPTEEVADVPIRVGVSACLLGERVRFDRGHKHNSYITGTLSAYFEFVPLCPEMAIGLGAPRQPIRLTGDPDHLRAVGVKDAHLDVTEPLREYGLQQARALGDISGYILKRGSPSCGMERVKLYNEKGMPAGSARGIYAQALMEQRPLLPVEEEGRLGDPVLRENFITRVFAHDRWRRLVRRGLTPAALIAFHTAHKLLLMAHEPKAYQELGRLVAEAGSRPLEPLGNEYFARMMGALRRRAGRRHHVNVLQHLLGYLRHRVDAEDRAELVDLIEQYRCGQVPLIVPMTLFKHHFRRHRDPYVERQHYLTPHPGELMLRNLI